MGIIHSTNYSITKKLINKIFIQKIWKIFITKNYQFFWKIDYRPGLCTCKRFTEVTLHWVAFLHERTVHRTSHFSAGKEPQFTFVTRQLRKVAQTFFLLPKSHCDVALRGSRVDFCPLRLKSLHRVMRNSPHCLWRLSALPSYSLQRDIAPGEKILQKFPNLLVKGLTPAKA